MNPGHLRWKTHSANHAERHRHGTIRITNMKLSPQQVRAIRRWKGGAISQSKLGKRYGVSQCTISMVQSGKRWKSI